MPSDSKNTLSLSLSFINNGKPTAFKRNQARVADLIQYVIDVPFDWRGAEVVQGRETEHGICWLGQCP